MVVEGIGERQRYQGIGIIGMVAGIRRAWDKSARPLANDIRTNCGNRQGLLRMIRNDRRFRRPALVPNGDVIAAYAQADVCVIPSICLETGPLAVFESFAAGTPVVGSRLGGIAELVRDGVDGLLFPAGDAAALSNIIRTLAEDRGRVRSLELGIRPPRTMADVARDTAALYEELLARAELPREGRDARRQPAGGLKTPLSD